MKRIVIALSAVLLGVTGVGVSQEGSMETQAALSNPAESLIIKEIQGESLTYHIVTPDPIMGSTATIITAGDRAFLVDTQFSKRDAEKVVNYLKARGLRLEMIYISHGDPDYYFGLPTLLEAFPEADAYATQETIEHIAATVEAKLAVWAETLKEDAPTEISLPKAIEGEITFGDNHFLIVGNDPKRTSLYNEADRLLLGGISISADSHLFIADTKSIESQQSWIEDLIYFESLKPAIVIPGHFGAGNRFGIENIHFTKTYLERFLEAEAQFDESNAIIAYMKEYYPELNDAVLPLSAQVVTGEVEWE